jgi:hypothetical protein
MNRKRTTYSYHHLIVILIGLTLIFSLGFLGDDVTGNKRTTSKVYKPSGITQGAKHGDSYRLNINNINLPMNRSGVLADVNIPPEGTLGRYDNIGFIFSSGFFLSGYSGSRLWANAVASASLVRDYLPGPVGPTNPNAVMYVLKRTDPPGGQAYQEWADAVALGADFYDVDGDGIYNPNIDHPDLLGDETVWCVYNDGTPSPQRRWNAVDPVGIEIRQTVFGLASKGAIGNILFLRYRIKYVGVGAPNEPDKLDSVYFGVWADPDIGFEHQTDLVGSDIPRNAIYTYKSAPDPSYGNNPPAYFITFFSGPVEYVPGETFIDVNENGEYDDGVDEPLDTAYSVRGQAIGTVAFPGARNQPLSSVVEYLNGFSPEYNDPGDHVAARNFMLGRNRDGSEVDPCTFPIGEVRGGVDCNTIDPRFWFSGDPVSNVGWIGTQPWDVRMMANTGPFTLYKDTPENRNAGRLIEKEIVAAYVVGRGTDRLNSITVAREINDISQEIFDNNFPSPPPPPPIAYETKTGPDFIDITWLTAADGQLPIGRNPGDHVRYRAVDEVLDVDKRVQGFYVTAFRTRSTQQTIGGVANAIELANYSIHSNDTIKNIYYSLSNGGIELRRAVAPDNHLLDSTFYSDPAQGRIRLTITEDPFTGGPLVKGKEYYFTITQYTLNHTALVNRAKGDSLYGGSGDYLEIGVAYEEFELLSPRNQRDAGYQIGSNIIRVIFGEDSYSPAISPNTGTRTGGASDGEVKYITVFPEQLTGNTYTVDLIKDNDLPPGQTYLPYWRLINSTTGQVLIDSSKVFNFDTTSYAGRTTEGFILKVKPLIPEFISNRNNYSPFENSWIAPFSTQIPSGIFYVGQDVPQGTFIAGFPTTRSNAISADRLRHVEIRFGQNSKAYRYLNGYIGANLIAQRNSYVYASRVTSADTVGKGTVGNWDTANDRANGFVDVPFQAWVVDEKYGEEYQLATGFLERRRSVAGDFNGRPDGIWDPDTSINRTGEVIFIYDAPYDENGGHIEYTGGTFSTGETVWANLSQGFTIPDNAQGIDDRQREIAASPWFNSLYVAGFQRATLNAFYTPGDVFTIPVAVYPYTDSDQFTFTTLRGGDLTEADKKALFDMVNVFPNPLYGFNPATSYSNTPSDEPFVTFSNLPEDVTIKIFTLSGTLIRTLGTGDKSNPSSPYLRWNLLNENGLRAASGLYIAIVSAPGFGEKVLKFSIIMPQKQLQRF